MQDKKAFKQATHLVNTPSFHRLVPRSPIFMANYTNASHTPPAGGASVAPAAVGTPVPPSAKVTTTPGERTAAQAATGMPASSYDATAMAMLQYMHHVQQHLQQSAQANVSTIAV